MQHKVGRSVHGPDACAKSERGLNLSGSWSECMRGIEWRLCMNPTSQSRMTNDEIRRNTEIRMTNGPLHSRAPFEIRASNSLRHLSFAILSFHLGLLPNDLSANLSAGSF